MIYLFDYDAGNLLSIERSLNFLNFDFLKIKKIETISYKDILLIPGVGSFESASLRIKSSGLLELANLDSKERPFILGICLGMQLLMSCGYEGKKSAGLNLIEGSVQLISQRKPQDLEIPKTIIGWEEFEIKNQFNKSYKWLNKYKHQSFYHVHSYMCVPKNPKNIIATYSNELSFIPNIVGDFENKVLGFQFNPEKSGIIGLNLLIEPLNLLSKKI